MFWLKPQAKFLEDGKSPSEAMCVLMQYLVELGCL